MCDAVIFFQELAKYEEVIRVKALVAQIEQCYIVQLDCVQLHESAINC